MLMPVEIREIVVKTHIEGKSQGVGNAINIEQLNELKQEIIEECIEQVLASIKKQQER
jgi:hypothetical protein